MGVGEEESSLGGFRAKAHAQASLSLTRLRLLCVVELDRDATRMVLLFDHRVIAR
jgi:hypothetical protein